MNDDDFFQSRQQSKASSCVLSLEERRGEEERFSPRVFSLLQGRVSESSLGGRVVSGWVTCQVARGTKRRYA